MLLNTIYRSSNLPASFFGFDNAQKAWNNYKQSKYIDCCREIASIIGKLSCVFSLGVLVYVSACSESENTFNTKAANLLNERDIPTVKHLEDPELNFATLLRNVFQAFTLTSSLNPVTKNIASATLVQTMKNPAVRFSGAAMVKYYIKGADSFNLYRSRRVAEMVDGLIGKHGSKIVATIVNGLVGAHRFIPVKKPSQMLSKFSD